MPIRDDPQRIAALSRVGHLLMLLTAIPYLWLTLSQIRLSMSGYAGLYAVRTESTQVAIASIAGNLFVSGLLFAMAGSIRHRVHARLLLALALGDVTVSLFVGTRGRAFMLLFAVLFVWTKLFGALSKPTAATLIVASLFAVPLVSILRNLPAAERLAPAQVTDALQEVQNPAIATLNDMGLSFAPTAFTIELVPIRRDFEWGLSYLRAIALVTPLSGRTLSSEDNPVLLGDWLIREVDQRTAADNGGLGFSFIAEAYLNFGIIGAPIACGGIGYMLAWLLFRVWTLPSIAFVSSVLLSLLLFSRGETGVTLRGIVWTSVIPIAAVELLRRRAARTSLRASSLARPGSVKVEIPQTPCVRF